MGPKKRIKSGSGGGGGGTKVGHILIKDRNRSRRRTPGASWRHTSELDDGYNWGRLNLRSVTEESQLDEFLSIAQLAGTEFTAEKLNMKVVSDIGRYTGLPSQEQREATRRVEEEKKHYLSIPRRPSWDSDTTAEELELLEREAFLTWRRSLVELQEDERLTMTPFERNLEFWRQLWRVVEKSDMVVQILDARDPLLFRCEDLEKYVREINPAKVNVLLLSKADLISIHQRRQWLEYFREDDSIVVAFWSATMETERLDSLSKEDKTAVEAGSGSTEDTGMDFEERNRDERVSASPVDGATPTLDGEVMEPVSTLENADFMLTTPPSEMKDETVTPTSLEYIEEEEAEKKKNEEEDEAAVLNGEQLLELLMRVSPVAMDSLTTVGMVGYPNVGKSSTINALFRGKKVPVSATPGRTKHFQTLYLNERVLVCDCPGLVFPSFVSSKAEMICSGILPIDQMRDHIPPVSLVCQRIPWAVLERTYGVTLPPPSEGEEPDRIPYANELLSTYGKMRGYMTSHGQPDEARSSRYILKDYVSGKLLFCHPPPGVEEASFNHHFFSQPSCPASRDQAVQSEGRAMSEEEAPAKVFPRRGTKSDFDDTYFKRSHVQAIVKGVSTGLSSSGTSTEPTMDGKQWKKHYNKHKKEKTRRTCPSY